MTAVKTRGLPEKIVEHSAADLNLSPIWSQREVDGSKRYEKHYDAFLNSLIVAWLEQAGSDCPKCGKEMKKSFGKPNEIANLAYITSLNEEGSKGLENIWVLCGECFSKQED